VIPNVATETLVWRASLAMAENVVCDLRLSD